MQETFHYLLMSDHLMVQKALVSSVKDTRLTPGQPKILDYLLHHDGAIQKEIAIFCHIEPASLTAILNGMENKGYIERRTAGSNRRSLHVYLTETGKNMLTMDKRSRSLILIPSCTHRSRNNGVVISRSVGRSFF